MSGWAGVDPRSRRVWARDLPAVGVAVATAVAAWWSPAVPVWSLGAVATLALSVRRPWTLAVLVVVATAWLSVRAEHGLVAPAAAPFSGVVTLTRDPEVALGAQRAEGRAGGRRVEVWARGAAAGALASHQAGERLTVTGRVEPTTSPWLRWRHVVTRLSVERVVAIDAGDPVSRLANTVRSTLARGADVLPSGQRALFTGLVFGDDREQAIETADDFRAAGLTHLLAVSGQNVAFVLLVAEPLLGRLGLRGRLVATVAVLAFFALATRFEPSVLRATVMAGLAASAAAVGRPVGSLRLLALTVTALVVLDPFLVHSVGFALSVAASAGIVVLAPALGAVLPGPRWLRLPLAVTVAAQLGAAPVVVTTFGGLPVAAVPANLLAEPVAGLVMSWGLVAGLVAGAFGPPVATVVHAPTGLALAWVAGVARVVGGWPLGQLGPLTLGALVSAGTCWAWARRRHPLLAAGCAVVVVALVVAPAVALARGPTGTVEVAGVGTLVRADHRAVLVLASGAEPSDVLAALRGAGVRRLDLLVLPTAGRGPANTSAVLRRRVAVAQVWAPPGSPAVGAEVPAPGSWSGPAGTRLEVRTVAPVLHVEIAPAGGGESRSGV